MQRSPFDANLVKSSLKKHDDSVQIRPSPFYGVASCLSPFVGGIITVGYGISNSNAIGNGLVGLIIIAVILSTTAGVIFAIWGLVRRERWKYLAILGLLINLSVVLFLLISIGINRARV